MNEIRSFTEKYRRLRWARVASQTAGPNRQQDRSHEARSHEHPNPETGHAVALLRDRGPMVVRIGRVHHREHRVRLRKRLLRVAPAARRQARRDRPRFHRRLRNRLRRGRTTPRPAFCVDQLAGQVRVRRRSRGIPVRVSKRRHLVDSVHDTHPERRSRTATQAPRRRARTDEPSPRRPRCEKPYRFVRNSWSTPACW